MLSTRPVRLRITTRRERGATVIQVDGELLAAGVSELKKVILRDRAIRVVVRARVNKFPSVGAKWQDNRPPRVHNASHRGGLPESVNDPMEANVRIFRRSAVV